MPQNINIKRQRLKELKKKLEINNKDVNEILKNSLDITEETYLSAGPNPYCGGYYGSVSIKDL